MKKFILFMLSFLVAACGNIQVPQSPALKFFERKSGLIAYIGIDGNVYITDQAATSTTPLTEDITEETQGNILYQLPTWSHDGGQLAFIRLEQSGDAITSNLMVANVDDDTVTNVYTSNSEYPFYLSWSPDNQNIGALSTTAQKQTLLLQNIPADGSERQLLDTGSPFYWSWSPDGSAMIVHKNGAAENGLNQISFLKFDDELIEYVMKTAPASFQAPAWSPDGAFILLTAIAEDGEQQIVLADSTGAIQRHLAGFDLNTAFAWATDSEHFAYIVGEEQMSNGVLGALHVANINNAEEIVVDKKVYGFFWSPDNAELAYFVPGVATSEDSSEQTLYFELNILDIASGESRVIATYQPTEEFANILPYIDQYHQSFTIWSPDSYNLVISFMNPQTGTPAIAIVPSSGVTEPRFLAEGSLGVWSWK